VRDGERHAKRLRAAAVALDSADLDAVVVPASPDLAYLIGYAPMPMERPTMLVVAPDGAPTLVVPTLERPLAAACPAADALTFIDWGDGTDPYPVVAALLPATGRVVVGDRIWGSHLLGLQAAAPHRRWSTAGTVLGPMRARKDDQELETLRRAAVAADASLEELLGTPLGGRTEIDVARQLARLLVEYGHDAAAFTIVASGPNAASPHHEAAERVIGPGDAIVLDLGGDVDGYYSDTTRTVVVGEASSELREIHAIVREAHAAALEAIRPGAEIRSVDRAARAVIESAGYGASFIHRTGHGIGLEVHEPPYVSENDGTVLAPGMTFSVEPGIYLPGRFGVRIEDIVAVTEVGADVLNRTTRALRSVA
jgi:D-alanyl-D-alanine dipeptidase